jgi:hypothetical protein
MINTTPAPKKYKIITIDDIKICVRGSTEGVSIAPMIVDPKMTYLHIESIVSPEIIRNNPNIT